MRGRTTSSFCPARSVRGKRFPSSPATSSATPLSLISSSRDGLSSTKVDSPGRWHENRTVVVESKPSDAAVSVRSRSTRYSCTAIRSARATDSVRVRRSYSAAWPAATRSFTPGLLPVDVAMPGGDGHGAMADDGGEATDHDLGDPAAFLAGSALQRAGAAHDHSLVDQQTV